MSKTTPGKLLFPVLMACAVAAPAHALVINTNDAAAYTDFASGATLQNFETTGSLVPFALDDYADGLDNSTAIPLAAQVSNQFTGLHFHSGGGSFNDPVGNPGTHAALLNLTGGLAGDAQSASNVIGALDLTSDDQDILKLDAFVEIIFTESMQGRVGFWLNPALGNVVFSAFDVDGGLLENVVGNAGNFVGISRDTNDIRFVSIVSQGRGVGFTIDDLTYGRGDNDNNTVPEPSTLSLIGLAGFAAWAGRRRREKPMA